MENKMYKELEKIVEVKTVGQAMSEYQVQIYQILLLEDIKRLLSKRWWKFW